MATSFKFPDVGEGIQEGEIVRWNVKEGDLVKKDQILAQVETDKAIVELPSPASGTVLKINFKEGQTVKVGETLIVIGAKGEKIPKETPTPVKSNTVMGVLEEADEEIVSKKIIKKTSSENILATPKVRALAKKLNIDLTTIRGTGKDGRIKEEDLSKKEPEIKVTKKYDMYGYVERIPLSGIRKTIATKLTQSFTIAHVTHMDEADITDLLKIKDKEKIKFEKKGIHITLAPFLIKALISSLKKHPSLNATFQAEEIILKKYYNIGVATDTEDGLMVPVLKIADQKTIFQLAQELNKLVEAAKSRKIDLADLQGSSFSLTNIGSIGGTYFTPIINPGDVAILGIGRILEKLFLNKGNIETRKILPLSLTFDHRALDGAEAAHFINTLKEYLEDPEELFIEN